MNTTKLTFNEITGCKEVAKGQWVSNGEQMLSSHIGDRMLKIGELQAMVPFSRSMLYKMIKEGRFPAPKKVGRSSRWLLSEVLAWMRACRAA